MPHSRDSLAIAPVTPTRLGTYRIEEYRRTTYVTCPKLPTSLQDVDTLLNGSNTHETDPITGSPPRRSKSLTEVAFLENRSSLTSLTWGSDRTNKHVSRRSMAVRPRALNSVNTPPSTPTHPHPAPHTPVRCRILFYHRKDPYYGFTNFSPHPVTYEGRRYPTSEHLFQSFKFQGHRPGLAEHIRTFSQWPSDAFREARRFQPEVRPDWRQVNIEKMDETLWYKFMQHHDLREELLATGDAELVEDSEKDPFWGIGADQQGRNELGKALERLRDRLRE